MEALMNFKKLKKILGSKDISEEQVKAIDTLIDKIGCTRADVVKQLALIKLAEMGYFNKNSKK